MKVDSVKDFVKAYIDNCYDYNLIKFSNKTLYLDLFDFAEKNSNEGVFQTILGYIYLNGHHSNDEVITPDYNNAFEWFSKAMSNGVPIGYYEIGKMYEFGFGNLIDKNLTLASTSYLQAAMMNCPQAMTRLGDWYYVGIVFNQDYKKAFNLYNDAYNLNYVGAINRLLMCYSDGHSVGPDSNKFFELLYEGYDKCDYYCTSMMAKCFLDGSLGFSKNPKRAFELYLYAAENEHVESMIKVGQMYYEGIGVNADFEKSLIWYVKAASCGDVFAMVNVGLMYLNGVGTAVDVQKCLKWLNLASNRNSHEALFNLGLLYELGKYVSQDSNKAFEYFTRAVNLGDVKSMYMLSIYYLEGITISADISYGIELLKKAADNGNVDAMNSLGALYSDGNYCDIDYKEARLYYKLSMEQGDKAGRENYFKINKIIEEKITLFEKILNEIGTPSKNIAFFQLRNLANKGYIQEPVYEKWHTYDSRGNMIWNVSCEVKADLLNDVSVHAIDNSNYTNAEKQASYIALTELLEEYWELK